MEFTFNPFGPSVDVMIEQYIGNQIVNQQWISGPPMLLQTQFIQSCQEMMGQSPMKLKMLRYENIWDQFEQKIKPLEYSVEFQNWRDE